MRDTPDQHVSNSDQKTPQHFHPRPHQTARQAISEAAYQEILVAVGLGEVLGSTYEFRQDPFDMPSYEDWRETLRNEKPEAWRKVLDGAPWNHIVSATGDDVYFTLALAESLTEKEGFDGARTAEIFLSKLEENDCYSIGRATHIAFENLKKGLPWDQCGAPEEMAGNGSLMRFSPVALLRPHDPEWIIQASQLQSIITHQDKRAAFSAAGASLVLSSLLRGEPCDREAFAEILVSHLKQHFPKWIHMVDEWMNQDEDLDSLFDWVARLGSKKGEISNFVGGYAPATLFWTLSLVTRFKNDIMAAIYEVDSRGATMPCDTDTVAAVTSAFSAALGIVDPLFFELIPNIDRHEALQKMGSSLFEKHTDQELSLS
jgi:ADP-ribosylglycohydrolase